MKALLIGYDLYLHGTADADTFWQMLVPDICRAEYAPGFCRTKACFCG